MESKLTFDHFHHCESQNLADHLDRHCMPVKSLGDQIQYEVHCDPRLCEQYFHTIKTKHSSPKYKDM